MSATSRSFIRAFTVSLSSSSPPASSSLDSSAAAVVCSIFFLVSPCLGLFAWLCPLVGIVALPPSCLLIRMRIIPKNRPKKPFKEGFMRKRLARKKALQNAPTPGMDISVSQAN
ncbi:hypothetical protein AKJ16_DCAP26490, partial [Drosera capensis]